MLQRTTRLRARGAWTPWRRRCGLQRSMRLRSESLAALVAEARVMVEQAPGRLTQVRCFHPAAIATNVTSRSRLNAAPLAVNPGGARAPRSRRSETLARFVVCLLDGRGRG